MSEKKSLDPYLVKPFSAKNKLLRFLWAIAWLLLCRWTPAPLHRWRIFVLRVFGAKGGLRSFVYPSCKIWAPWLLQMEDLITIGPGVEIYNPGGVYLGHHTILSQDAYLCGATHDYNSRNFTYLKKPITTEPYTWIGARAIVLPGVKCSEGCVLGAGSVAAKDLEAWSVYAGNPARKVKVRTKDV